MNPVVEALCRPAAYPHPTDGRIQLVETHISWIFLTGPFAYKLKKPVNLGFLDFSTLEKRRHFCLEELRLNRRLCCEIYLDVVPVVRCAVGWSVDGEGIADDYLVKMVQFDRNFELDRLLAKNRVRESDVDQISSQVAAFHESIPPAAPETDFGTPDVLILPVLENFTHTSQMFSSPEESAALEEIRRWTLQEHERLRERFSLRKRDGFVRQCHGDMHTGNMVLWHDKVVLFDCIEFNPNLSVIDTISDIAFLFMDLEHAGSSDLAWRFLNNYLSLSGDYDGLRLLRFYAVYRAMVRAKVTAIRYLQQPDMLLKAAILEEHRSYIKLAGSYMQASPPLLILTNGVSGSGKSTFSCRIANRSGFIHVRSDMERKRMFGLDPLKKNFEVSGREESDIYSAEATGRTYERLLAIGRLSLSSGYTIIIDATFIRNRERKEFMALAEELGCPARILCFQAPAGILRKRVEDRKMEGTDLSDADSKVLDAQLRTMEPLTEDERKIAIDIDTLNPPPLELIIQEIIR